MGGGGLENFLGHKIFSHLEVVHDIFFCVGSNLRTFFNIKKKYLDSRKLSVDIFLGGSSGDFF